MKAISSSWASLPHLTSRLSSVLRGERADLSAVVRGGRSALTPLDKRELRRLAAAPRFQPGDAYLFGKGIRFTDAASFVSAFESIFEAQIYDFNASRAAPVIIDGGANIGLATLYWSERFPSARITAFEPDLATFRVLDENMRRFGLHGVELRNEALWTHEVDLPFRPDGADAGRLHEKGTDVVRAVRLADLLNQPTDLLKLDIEGAEIDVVLDCELLLRNVEAVFIEYHGFADEGRRLESMLEVLTRQGMRYWIRPEFAPERPLVEVATDAGMDMRLNVFARRQEAAK
jgi:FkbM family methyltransferase